MRMRLPLAALLLTVASSAFAEPSIDEVYKAASSGRLAEAQTMMQEVLKAHPESAKAHFVEAELYARQGNLGAAREELARAKAINPGLSFAKPESLRNLQRSLGETVTASAGRADSGSAVSGVPSWVWPVGIGMAIAFMIWFARRNRPQPYASNGMPGTMPNGQPPYSPYGAQPPYGAPQSGMGSGLLGSLATGAAIGGGLVAGEALAHKLLGSDEPRHGQDTPPPADNNSNMGGDDFGVSDSGSWDDNSGGDW